MSCSTQIEGFTAELNEVSSKLQDLQDKLDEQKRQKAEHLAAIADAKSRCGQFSKSDVAKLQGESGSCFSALPGASHCTHAGTCS